MLSLWSPSRPAWEKRLTENEAARTKREAREAAEAKEAEDKNAQDELQS